MTLSTPRTAYPATCVRVKGATRTDRLRPSVILGEVTHDAALDDLGATRQSVNRAIAGDVRLVAAVAG
jgi:hypothetical protein